MGRSKPILVTGSHRSGTTWVGRMIASSPAVLYIHEPFNVKHYTDESEVQFRYWFTHLCQENEGQYYRYIKNILDFRYDLPKQLRSAKTLQAVKEEAKNYIQHLQYRLSGIRPLIKDPIALFSAEWFSSRFNADVLVMIRHPAAFAGSLKVKNWNFPFSDLINQPLLMERYLYPFEAEIIEFAEVQQDIVDQAALLWKLLHYVILHYQKTHPEWLFVRHEDLSQHPLAGFQAIFEQLNLEFTPQSAAVIQSYSSVHQSDTLKPEVEYVDLKRDSLANILTWKQRLTASEIERIRQRVQDVSLAFYADNEW